MIRNKHVKDDNGFFTDIDMADFSRFLDKKEHESVIKEKTTTSVPILIIAAYIL